MRRWIALAALALAGSVALAADNATLITPCGSGCVTVRAKDIGAGVQSPVYILGDTSGNPIYGTAGTANSNVLTVQGIAAMTALKVDGSGVTQPVNGTVTANQGGAPWSVSQSGAWTVTQGSPPWTVQVTDRTATGTVTSNNQVVVVSNAGEGNVTAIVTADTNITLAFEGTVDTTNWVALNAYPIGGGASVTSTAANGSWSIPSGGLAQVRLRVTAAGATPTATISLNAGAGSSQPVVVVNPTAGNLNVSAAQSGTWNVTVNTALPAGSNQIGTINPATPGTWGLATGQNASSPSNELVGGCQFNTSPSTISSGNVSPLQCDNGGKLLVDTGTVTVTGTVSTNGTDNVTQFGGTNLSTGTGAGGAGIPRVTVSNDSAVKVWDGTNTTAVKASGTNAATTDPAAVVAPSPNPSTVCTSIKPISQTSSTDLITSTNKLHICAVLIVSASAQSVSLVEGTGSVCASGTAALFGATTAANGMALAANGGFAHTAERAFMVTQTTADHLCLLQSGAGNVSGFISYVDHN